MSFNVQNTTGLPFLVLCVLVMAKVEVETFEAQVVFWVGAVLTLVIFWVFYAPATQGEPGGAFCCGFLALGGPAAYGVFSETGRALLGPYGVALAPWIALSAGPVAVLVALRFSKAKQALDLGAAKTEIAQAEGASALVPFLIARASEARDLAARRLLDLAPGPQERTQVITACAQSLATASWDPWHDEAIQRVFEVCRSLGPIPEAGLLDLYATQAGARGEALSRLVERELLAIDWADRRGHLIEAARRRAQELGGDVDAVVISLFARDRDASKALAELALSRRNIEGKTALIFGAQEGNAMLSQALEDEPTLIPFDFVDAALALPPATGYALLARILRSRDDLDSHVRKLMDEIPLLFAQASEAPEAARDLLSAIESLREAKADSSYARETWARAAGALRKALGD